MEPKLAKLKARIQSFLEDQAELQLAYAAGQALTMEEEALHARYPELCRVDTFLEAREAFEGARPDTREGLGRICLFLASVVAGRLSAEAEDWLARAELTARPWEDDPSLSLTDGLRSLRFERAGGRRRMLSRALETWLQGQERWLLPRFEADRTAAGRLEFDGPLALWKHFDGQDLAELEQQASAYLSRTEDPYRDLLGYVIHRVDATTAPMPGGGAQLHDLVRGLATPWMFEHLGKPDVSHGTHRWLEEWRLPHGAGRIDLDDSDRPGKPFAPRVVGLRIPARIRGFVRAEVGMTDARELLEVTGRALALALRDATLPLEELRLGRGTWEHAASAFFSGMLIDERWVERYLRLPRSVARELSRFAAFADVATTREQCAALQYELHLHRHGVDRDSADAYEDLRRKALFVSIPRGLFLWDISPRLEVAERLRGIALEARVRRHLRERFDEDAWRNPAAAGFLRDLLAKGDGTEPVAVARGVLGEWKLEDAVTDRVQAMGA